MNMIATSGQLRAGYVRWALVLVPGLVLIGVLVGRLSDSGPDNLWFSALQKPAAYPPPALFGLVWTLLYGMMGLSLAVVISAVGAAGRKAAVIAFFVQFVLNLAWSPVFFGLHRITWSLGLIAAIDLAVAVTIVLFWRVRKLAAVLLLPYLAWLGFATYLNFAFLQANPELDGQQVTGEVQRIEF